MENSRSCSDKSPISPLPVPPHLIRSARRRDSAARGTGRTKFTVNLVGKMEGKRGGTKISRWFSSDKSILSIGGGDYGCPALSPRGGGFASSSSFSFSSFLVLALDCYLLSLRFERWRSLLPIPECSGRHCRKYVFCRSDLAEYVGRKPVTVDIDSGEHVQVVPLNNMPSRLGKDEGAGGDVAGLQV